MKNQILALSVLGVLVSCHLQAADSLPHPILTISGSGSGANTVTNILESDYTNNFIPHTPPRNDAQGFVPAVVSGDTGWSWSSSTPNQIKSTPSGTIFPNTNTATYPVRTQAVNVFLTTVSNNAIQTVNALYYNKAGSTTSKSFVFNLIDMHKRDQLRGDLDKLAPAYMSSGGSPAARNDNYARRIAVSLLDWGRSFPKYFLSPINSAGYIDVTPNYTVGLGGFGPERASDHNGMAHEWQEDELKAFDAVYDSVALTNMNAEMGYDVRQYICDNLFFNEGDFIVNHVPISIAIQSNLSGPYAILPEVARVLDRPDYIIFMDSYLDATVRQKIRRDGALEEGEGYSIGYLNSNQDAAQNTHDYFLTRAATNSLLLSISNRSLIFNTTLTYGQGQWATIALPNGQLPSFGDTPFNTYFSARNKGSSAILPAYGTLALGTGTSSSTAVQLNQNFSGDNNHMRADMAAFTLWTFNNEYLGNIRYYNGAIGRNFGEHILAYNTITVDRSNLSPYTDADTSGNGNLNIYETGNNGLALTEIDGFRAYSSKASRFQRMLLMNTVDSGKPYVVDVFRVSGGTTHDYTFHGSVRWTQSGAASFPLVTNNNQYPMLEGAETWSLSSDTPEYGFWRGVNSNSVPGNFYLTFSDTNRSSARDTRLWMTADPNLYTLYLGWTPVPARDDTVPTNFFNNLGLTRPSAIIRHRVGSGTLQDLFVSVVEPFNAGVSNIVSVTRLAMGGATNESVGLKVVFKDGRTDTYIINLRNLKIAGAGGGAASVSTVDGQYTLAGRVGLHVDRPTSDPRVWTINATDFKYPGRELITPANTYFSGWIAGSLRRFDGQPYDAFYTSTPLPTNGLLQNKYLSLTHGSMSGTTNISELYKIEQVVLTNGFYHICFTNDHMLEITNGVTSREQVAPLRSFTTSNAFEIVLSAFAGQISAIADQNIPPGGNSGPLAFTYGGLGNTAGSSLQISASSTNQTLVPNGNLVIGGSGTNRTITVTPAAGQTGLSLVTVSVTDGLWTNSRSFSVAVGNFAVVTTPASQSVLASNSVVYTNIVSATNGSGTVSFSISGLPVGAAANFVPPTFTDAGTNTLTVSTATNTPAGTYPLTIIASTGTLAATNTVTLVVNVVTAAPGWSTWLGGAGNNNWSQGANWNTPLIPNNSMAFGGISRLNNLNDTPAATIYSNIIFNPGAGGFTLGGNPITLITGITNNSAVAQNVGVGINYANSLTFNGASNALIIAGGLTNRISGNGTATIALIGTGTLVDTFNSPNSPGGTNIMAMSSGTANWTIADNAAASAISAGPWALQINSGTLNFGDGTSAPNLNLITGVSGQDNEIGRTANATGTLNINSGTLTTTVRINTGTSASGSTGIVNQAGGTVNIGNQFQGANIAGGNSIVNLSGGTMNINGGSGTFYVASRGKGVLNLSGDGTLSCGKLDVSRNAAGTTSASAGTVNLDGGLLSVTSVSNVTANAQTGSSPTATFNFNGGTLQAKAGAATMFFQGSHVTPIMPIQAFVKAGGALIDDGGQSITIGDPMKHDPALGTDPDGGLAKLGAGTLTLSATNTYTGDTTINAGTLALSGNGSITNSANLILVGTTLDASARANSTFTLASGQTLLGNGLLKGNVVLSGTLSPGDTALGLITNNGSLTLAADGRYLFDLADAAVDTTNLDTLAISGGLDVQSSSGNPFIVQLRSLDGDPNDGDPGAANFNNGTAQSWTLANADAGITNFSADKFSVDDGAFLNDLAGGYFVISTNSNALLLAFVPNNPPSANDVGYYLPSSGLIQIPLSTLAAQWSDPNGDPVQFISVNPNSANGINNVSSDANYIYYSGSAPDTISYTIGDLRTNAPAIYRPGDTQRTTAGLITLLPKPSIGTVNFNGGTLTFSGQDGIPNATFSVLSSTNVALPLAQWTPIATNQFDNNGNFTFTNTPNPATTQTFYLISTQ